MSDVLIAVTAMFLHARAAVILLVASILCLAAFPVVVLFLPVFWYSPASAYRFRYAVATVHRRVCTLDRTLRHHRRDMALRAAVSDF